MRNAQSTHNPDTTPEVAAGVPTPSPFSLKTVELTQAEYIVLKCKGNYYKRQQAHLKIQNEKLKHNLELAHATIRDLRQRLYGKKSEKKTTRRDQACEAHGVSSRSRGQQRGSQGHGRTARPDLPIVEEQRDVAPEDKKCTTCGKAYTPLAHTEDSKIIEVDVKAHVRLIKRKMYRQVCACAGVPGLITAPPAPRLIAKSPVGTSIWTEVLLSKYIFSRATYNLCTDYAHRGLPIAPGTLTGGLKRIAPLFAPLLTQLLNKQLSEALFHNDETGWKVFETREGKVGYRWWLWVTQSPSVVHYTMAPSRSGDIPIAHFSGLDKGLEQVIVVCDRYSGYKRLARENAVIVLAFCWAHVRRDFLDAAKSHPELQDWMFTWVEMIAELYRLNAQRLAHWDAALALADQTPAFMEHHQALVQAIETMAACRDTQLANKSLCAAQRNILNSLKNHWSGLIVFVTSPQVPMDNNTAERRMRNPAMGRKNYYGSGSQWSGGLAAMMFSLFQTVLLWKLNPHHWLHSYLSACAEHGGQVPPDLSPFLPWQMNEERKYLLTKPMAMTAAQALAAEHRPPAPP